MFNRLTLRVASILLILSLFASPVFAQLGSVPYTFTAGNTILSTEVNANFSSAYANALNRTGGTVTGTIAVSADVTIDGVDISDFLDPSGVVFAGTAGTNTGPSFSRTGDTNTGMYFPAADQIALTLGGTQKLLLDTNGVTAYGVNIINSSGKIPAISSTYFASLAATNLTSIPANQLTGTAAAIDGSNITSLTATNLTGTIADARLSVNIPLINASNTWTGVTNTFSNSVAVGGAFSMSPANADMELGSLVSAGTPVVDFHSSGNSIDYDARIIASGGSGVSGNGTITITAALLQLPTTSGTWQAADGSAGLTSTFNPTTKTQLVFKNGLLISTTP